MIIKKDIRAILRPYVPLIFWKKMAFLVNCFFVIKKARGIGLLKRGGARDVLVQSDLEYPLHYLRLESHAQAIIQNCLRLEYDQMLPVGFVPETIVDGGAFIGDLSVHWSSRWRDVSIIAFEPNSVNFELASQNCIPYGTRIKLLRGALWSESTTLAVSGEEMDARVSKRTGGADLVRAWSIPDILTEMGWRKISILKLDVEGAEFEILGDSSGQWIECVDVLIVEFHDPKRQAEVERRLFSFGFKGRQHRSLYTFFRDPK